MSPDDHVRATSVLDRDIIAKSARENFPVAGWFIARELRATVNDYYAFARTADDIADDPTLDPNLKLRLLDQLEAGLAGRSGNQVALKLRESLAARGIPTTCASKLLTAFRADAVNRPIESVRDLDSYCLNSAAPVGEFLLALHGQCEPLAESDALCSALQILNHVQDVRGDLESLGRSYLPRQWIDPRRIAVDEPARMKAIALLLAHVDQLLTVARNLPGRLRHPRLSAQSAAIFCLASRLAQRLRRRDPWARRIALRPIDWCAAVAAGTMQLVAGRRRHV